MKGWSRAHERADHEDWFFFFETDSIGEVGGAKSCDDSRRGERGRSLGNVGRREAGEKTRHGRAKPLV